MKLEPDVVEPGALINRGRVEEDVALHGILHRAAENFAVGNVAIAAANHRADALDAEAQIGAGPFDFHAIGFVHERLQRFHARLQFPVIERADLEIEILERLRAHAGELRHGRRRPAQAPPILFS